MSPIPNKQIDGDVAVGRDMYCGGNAHVSGSAVVKHNLRVEGWLDARNIKGAGKGLFTTVENLDEQYPRPHNGWWALVGSTLPAAIYIASGGEWHATGEVGGEPSLDLTEYREALESLSRLMDKTQGDIADLFSVSDSIKELASEAKDTAVETRKDLDDLQEGFNQILVGDESDAIDCLKDVFRFLLEFKDTDTLRSVLNNLRHEMRLSIEQVHNDVGILSFVGILEHATDLIRSGLDGVYYCSWDGVFRQITPNEEDPTIVGRIVAVPEYNLMDGDRAVHASEQKLFRLGNRLYGYDAGSNMLRVLGYEGDGGGSGSGDGAPAITTDEIDSLIDRATGDNNEN